MTNCKVSARVIFAQLTTKFRCSYFQQNLNLESHGLARFAISPSAVALYLLSSTTGLNVRQKIMFLHKNPVGRRTQETQGRVIYSRFWWEGDLQLRDSTSVFIEFVSTLGQTTRHPCHRCPRWPREQRSLFGDLVLTSCF